MARKTWVTLTDAEKAQLVEAYEGGATGYACAKMLGVEDSTAINWLRKLGVTIRGKGGSPAGGHNRGGANTERHAPCSSVSCLDAPPLHFDEGRRWL